MFRWSPTTRESHDLLETSAGWPRPPLPYQPKVQRPFWVSPPDSYPHSNGHAGIHPAPPPSNIYMAARAHAQSSTFLYCFVFMQVCQSVKFLMLHLRDCDGRTRSGQPCPMPWCQPCMSLLHHLIQCPESEGCQVRLPDCGGRFRMLICFFHGSPRGLRVCVAPAYSSARRQLSLMSLMSLLGVVLAALSLEEPVRWPGLLILSISSRPSLKSAQSGLLARENRMYARCQILCLHVVLSHECQR